MKEEKPILRAKKSKFNWWFNKFYKITDFKIIYKITTSGGFKLYSTYDYEEEYKSEFDSYPYFKDENCCYWKWYARKFIEKKYKKLIVKDSKEILKELRKKGYKDLNDGVVYKGEHFICCDIDHIEVNGKEITYDEYLNGELFK